MNHLRMLAPALLVALGACAGEPEGIDAGADLDATPPRADAAPAVADAAPIADAAGAIDASAPADAAPPTDAGAAPRPLLELVWTPCPRLGQQMRAGVDCGETEAPLRWSEPDGPRITLFVKRVRAAQPDGRRVWLLAGGPGFGGDSMEQVAQALVAREPGLEVYLPDHRGTGRSSRLGCLTQESPFSPGQNAILESEWAACRASIVAEWGEGLRWFDSFGAAEDLAELIRATDAPGARTFVLGVSYGTFWANRYVQLFPHQAAGVVFDSICAPGHCFITDQDRDENRVAEVFFRDVCGADPTCASKLGADPWAAVGALHQRLRDGHCPVLSADAAQGSAVLKQVLSQLVLQADVRPVAAALVYRLTRCSPDDVQAIQALFSGGGGGGASRSYSFPLAINIVVQEMWGLEGPTRADLEQRFDEAWAARGVSAQCGWQGDGWPVPASVDPRVHALGTSTVPMLMLQAEIDPATPVEIARPMAAHFTGAHQTYVEVPHASHTVLFQSPRVDVPGETCGLQLTRQFLADPRAVIDTGCTTRTAPPVFAATSTYSRAIFGTADLWE